MDQALIPVGQLVSGFNYRRKFDPVKMQELVDDIKEHGLVQAILVRPIGDKYQVIAGGRRVEAFKTANGPEGKIPALVRIMSDEEATAAMASENKVREDTNAIEDSELAARMLGLCNGDKAETLRRLGWKDMQILNRRLAIMNAVDEVRDAFIDDTIKLGHVEILATMPKEIQRQVMGSLRKAPQVPTVDQLKKMAEHVILNLEAAIFDKTECQSCQYFTGQQQAMFETTFEGTRCTNRTCYESKTEVELEKRRVAMTDTYQVVRIVRPGENNSVQMLKADGPKGVGEAQAKACRTCGDFGACISAAPDKLGRAFVDVCFNATCNAEKVAANASAIKAEQEALEAAKKQSEPTPDGGAKTETKSDKKPEKTDAKPAPVASSEPRNAVREYRERIWRLIFNRAALSLSVERSRALLVSLCIFRPSVLSSHQLSEALAAALGKAAPKTTETFNLATEVLGYTKEELSIALQHIPAFVSSDIEIRAIVGFLKALDVNIAMYWKIKAEFLDLLTKVEIDAVCVELGLDKVIGADYSKLKNGGKADFIKAILAAKDFDFRGAIPKLMQW